MKYSLATLLRLLAFAFCIAASPPVMAEDAKDLKSPSAYVDEIDAILRASDGLPISTISFRISLLLQELPDAASRNIVVDQAAKRYFSSPRDFAYFEHITSKRSDIGNVRAAYQLTLNDVYEQLQDRIASRTGAQNILGQQLLRATADTVDEIARSEIISTVPNVDRTQLERLIQNFRDSNIPVDLGPDLTRLLGTNATAEGVVQLKGIIDKAFRDRATALDKLKERQENLAKNIKVQADKFIEHVQGINEQLRATNSELTDIRRKLSDKEATKDPKEAKRLKTALLTKAQDALTIADALNFAVAGNLQSKVSSFARTQEDIQRFKAIDISRDGMLSTARDYASGMNTFLSDLEGLGVKVPENIKKGSAIASAAIGLVGNIATGNYLGAVFGGMGALGIGAGPGDSNQQVLSGINQILEGQRIIMQKLDLVLKTQHEILKALGELSKQIETNQQELRARFDNVDQKLDALSNATYQALGLLIVRCDQPSEVFKAAPDYDRLEFDFRDAITASNFRDCQKGLSDHFNAILVSADLSLNAAATNAQFNDAERRSREEALSHFRSALKLLEAYGDSALTGRILRKFRYPVPSVMQMNPEILNKSFDTNSLPPVLLFKVDATAIDETSLTQSINYLLFAAAIPLEVLDQDLSGRLLSRDKALSKINSMLGVKPPPPNEHSKHPNQPFRYALENAVDLIDTAIAQQAMLSGDALIMLVDALAKQPEGRQLALNYLNDHRLFASNYILYRLRRAAPGLAWARQYEEAYLSGNLPAMKALTRTEKISFRPEGAGALAREISKTDSLLPGCSDGLAIIPVGWTILLDECIYVRLPTPEEFAAGTLHYTDAFYRLLALRERVVDAIRAYELTAPSMSLVSNTERLRATAFSALKPFLSQRAERL